MGEFLKKIDVKKAVKIAGSGLLVLGAGLAAKVGLDRKDQKPAGPIEHHTATEEEETTESKE